MAGEALQAKAPARGDQVPFTLELFAAVLARAPFQALGPDDARTVAWAHEEAARMQARGRAPHGADAMALRLIYASLREHASTAPPVAVDDRAPRWETVMRATCNLKHRQRAALTAYYCAGLSEDAVASVIGTSPARGREVIERAVAGVARALAGPVDVRRSLRMAVARMDAARDQDGAPAEAPPRRSSLFTRPEPGQPRDVIRNWITAPVTAHESLRARIAASNTTPPVIPKGSPVRVLLETGQPKPVRPAPAARPAPVPVRVARPRAPSRRWPAAIAAAAATLVLAVLVPVAAQDAPADGPVPPTAQVAPAVDPADVPEVKGVRHVRVRPGDSLWAIAGKELGDPLRWTRIWKLNRHRVMTGGERFVSAGLIKPGWTLELPKGKRR